MRRFILYLTMAAIAVVALMAAACGGDDNASSTPTAAGTHTTAATATSSSANDVARTMPGAAGIASNPRTVVGTYSLDDGLGMFQSRPSSENRTGVTSSSVKICYPVTQTGTNAFYAGPISVVKGFIDKINAAGGVQGRQIKLEVGDDGGTPATASTLIKQMTESDGCFALFGHISGPGVFQAVQPYVEQQGIPYFMPAESGSYFGEPPVTGEIAGVNPATGAFLAFGRIIYKLKPDAKVSVLYVGDAYGQSGIAGLEAANAENSKQFVQKIEVQPAQADYAGEVGQALQGDPTGIILMGYLADLPKMVKDIRETYGSNVQIYDPGGNTILSAAAIPTYLNGIVSFNFSTVRETVTDNPTVALANKIQTDAGLTAAQFSIALGSVMVEHLTRALECAGPDLTREGFNQATDGGCFDGTWKCSTCLGYTVLNKYDHWATETIQGQEYSDSVHNWVPKGDTVTFETSKGASVRGNIPGFECGTKGLECPWKNGCTLDSADRCLFQAAFP
jgi:branched-chain amino acid transport system substrate-binding protein